MFGTTVYVNYNGKLEKVLVACKPNTPYEVIKEKAVQMLHDRQIQREEDEQNYLMNNLEEIISQQIYIREEW